MIQCNRPTKLFLPSWWVQAFEAISTQQLAQNPLLPILSLEQLHQLAFIINCIQQQILSNAESEKLASYNIVLNKKDIKKHLPLTNARQIHLFEQSITLLPALRLVRLHENSNNENKDLEIRYIFSQNERWINRSTLHYELQLNPYGIDLILGYTHPYRELIEKLSLKTASKIRDYLHEFPALMLNRASWNHLTDIEQNILLRMEKSMQWHAHWLHFSAICGLPLLEIFKGLPRPLLRGNASNLSEWEQMARVLDKVGRKLSQHGLIRTDVDDDYLLLDLKQGPILCWQAMQLPHHTAEFQTYRKACLRYLSQRLLNNNRTLLLDVWSGGNTKIRHLLSQILSELWEINKDHIDDLLTPVAFETTVSPLPLLFLYVEWWARSQDEHPCKLPSHLMGHPAVQECFHGSKESPSIQFEQFKSFCLDNTPTIATLVEQDPHSLFAHPDYTHLDSIKAYLRATTPYQPVRNAQTSSPLQEPTKHQTSQGNQQPRHLNHAPVNTLKLKQLAAKELNRIKKDDLQYASLRTQYLNSISDAQKQLILEMQKRLPAESFDKQITQSLIKYMIDNPGVWKSPSSYVKESVMKNNTATKFRVL